MNVLTRSVKEAKGVSTKSAGASRDDDKVTLSEFDQFLASGKIGNESGPKRMQAISGMLLKKSGGKHRRQH